MASDFLFTAYTRLNRYLLISILEYLSILAGDVFAPWEVTAKKRRSRLVPILPDDWPERLPRLPVNSTEEFDQFEVLIREDRLFQFVVKYLSTLGGGDMAEITRKVMARLMTNRVAEAFNWAGRAPKRAFSILRSRDLVICSVQRNPLLANLPVSDNQIGEVVKCWLKYAAWRR